LLELLARYGARHPDERDVVSRFDALLRSRSDCFLRSCTPGHVTASAWILSPDEDAVLLGHHRKLGRWLQLGGHADGESDTLAVALREAEEESGLAQFELPLLDEPAPLPLDLDVHTIPARGDEPAHLHYDVRWLLVAAPAQSLRVSAESFALRWVPRTTLSSFVDDESLLRMERKALASAAPGVRPREAARQFAAPLHRR
jgi:8-oxo-dGTP pyrophosphatase MutT (NUDIX family)